jgi:hypothetical protein
MYDCWCHHFATKEQRKKISNSIHNNKSRHCASEKSSSLGEAVSTGNDTPNSPKDRIIGQINKSKQ